MTVANPTEGMKVRVLKDTNYSKFTTGTVVELVEEAAPGFWLATTDPTVREWRNTTPAVCKNVDLNDVEPVVIEFKAGDRVVRNAKDHMYGRTNYGHREAAEGTLGTVTGYGYGYSHGEPKPIRVEWDEEGRIVHYSVIDPEGLDLYVPVTLDDIAKAIESVTQAELAVKDAEHDVTYYEAELARVQGLLKDAEVKRDELAEAAKTVATAFKG